MSADGSRLADRIANGRPQRRPTSPSRPNRSQSCPTGVTYFDGCNSCSCGTENFCTLKACNSGKGSRVGRSGTPRPRHTETIPGVHGAGGRWRRIGLISASLLSVPQTNAEIRIWNAEMYWSSQVWWFSSAGVFVSHFVHSFIQRGLSKWMQCQNSFNRSPAFL